MDASVTTASWPLRNDGSGGDVGEPGGGAIGLRDRQLDPSGH